MPREAELKEQYRIALKEWFESPDAERWDEVAGAVSPMTRRGPGASTVVFR